MSTCNFSLPSTAPTHYTIGVDERWEDWQFDDAIENVISELATIKGYCDDNSYKRDARVLGRFDLSIYDHEWKEWQEVSIYPTVESGYYAGAMFDYDLSDVEDYELNKTNQAKVDRIKRQIEIVYAHHTEQIVRVAVFSNGEGVYERAGNRSLAKAIVNS